MKVYLSGNPNINWLEIKDGKITFADPVKAFVRYGGYNIIEPPVVGGQVLIRPKKYKKLLKDSYLRGVITRIKD